MVCKLSQDWFNDLNTIDAFSFIRLITRLSQPRVTTRALELNHRSIVAFPVFGLWFLIFGGAVWLGFQTLAQPISDQNI